MRIVGSFFMFLFSIVSYSQTGTLDVYYYSDSAQDNLYTLEYQDSIYFSGNIDYESTHDSVPVGEYMLKLFVKGELIITYNKVKVLENQTTSIDFNTPNYYPYTTEDTVRPNTNITSKIESVLNLKLGHPLFDVTEGLLKYHIEIGENISFYRVTKYFSVAYSMGVNISLSRVISDTSFLPYPPYNFERFVYLTYSNGVMFRLTGYNNKTTNNHGPVIDVGAFYNFPLSLRHVGSMNHTKSKTNRLHRFNDFSAKVRVGFHPVAITAEYRLFNFIKPGYTQLPKLKLGISFFFEQE